MNVQDVTDLEACSRGRNPITGAIQPHGALLIVDESTLSALRATDNSGDLAGTIWTCDPTVVLLDAKPPRIDGLELLAQVNSNERLRRSSVVMLTSSHEDQDLGIFWALSNVPPPGSCDNDV